MYRRSWLLCEMMPFATKMCVSATSMSYTNGVSALTSSFLTTWSQPMPRSKPQ